MISFAVYLRDQRIGELHADLVPARRIATGYFDAEPGIDPVEIEAGLVEIRSLDGELSAKNVWLKLTQERGVFEADAEIRSEAFWIAAAGRT